MKRFFRFHLSTLVAVSILAGGAIWFMTSSGWGPIGEDKGIPARWSVSVPDIFTVPRRYNDGSFGYWIRHFNFRETTEDWIGNGNQYEGGMSYKALAFDIVFWLVNLLFAGILIEWLTRRFSRKATSAEP